MCYPSLNTISDDTGISLSTVKRAIPSLANMGYLKKINHKKSNGSATSNLYRFTDKVYGTDKNMVAQICLRQCQDKPQIILR